MRRPIIAGNWKMNKTMEEAKELVEDIKKCDLSKDVDAVLCVPFTDLKIVKDLIKDTDIKLGAQNMHYEESGAFTGEISVSMLKEIGIDYVILGHSERRQYFNELDERVNKKAIVALENNIKPIICVGETLEEREAGKEKEIVEKQVVNGLKDIESKDMKDIVIAYEPIWAIGTGKTASADDANDMCKFIRDVVGEIYDENEKLVVRIQYGGSVKPSNVSDIMSKSDVDGALVGGASLKAEDFSELVNF